jgi:hypothetical protein
MKIQDYDTGYGNIMPKDTPGMAAVKRAIKEAYAEQYMRKRLYNKNAPAWKEKDSK